MYIHTALEFADEITCKENPPTHVWISGPPDFDLNRKGYTLRLYISSSLYASHKSKEPFAKLSKHGSIWLAGLVHVKLGKVLLVDRKLRNWAREAHGFRLNPGLGSSRQLVDFCFGHAWDGHYFAPTARTVHTLYMCNWKLAACSSWPDTLPKMMDDAPELNLVWSRHCPPVKVCLLLSTRSI